MICQEFGKTIDLSNRMLLGPHTPVSFCQVVKRESESLAELKNIGTDILLTTCILDCTVQYC